MGAIIGCFIFMFLSDNIGRKFSLVLANMFMFLGAVIMSCSNSIEMACFGLVLAGTGVPSTRINSFILAEVV